MACNQDRRLESLDQSLESLSGQPPSALYPVPPDTLEMIFFKMDSLLGLMKALEKSRLSAQKKAEYPEIYRKWKERATQWRKLRVDPAVYNLGGELKRILSNTAPGEPEKARFLETALTNAPAYYRYARANLLNPDYGQFPLAVQKQILTLHFLEHELTGSLDEMQLETLEKEKLFNLIPGAKLAVKDYIGFCESRIWTFQDSVLRADHRSVDQETRFSPGR